MVKKITALVMAMAMLAGICLMSGCGIKGELITLREAYEANYITLDDVKSIAEASKYGGEYNPEESNKEIAKIGHDVRATAAERLCNMENSVYVVEATADDIFIYWFLGKYHNCYAFVLIQEGKLSILDPPRKYEIDGVEVSVMSDALFDDIMIYR